MHTHRLRGKHTKKLSLTWWNYIWRFLLQSGKELSVNNVLAHTSSIFIVMIMSNGEKVDTKRHNKYIPSCTKRCRKKHEGNTPKMANLGSWIIDNFLLSYMKNFYVHVLSFPERAHKIYWVHRTTGGETYFLWFQFPPGGKGPSPSSTINVFFWIHSLRPET